ncbi:PREDICTED: tetratricopeptide repeat protein 39B-like [Branchiostoma belcheri]|uniref:Tetratricopeptide repeat protein 39B-like n=1 Tax=Branchiostoma belcheri TaxID=7741 RepID=A0A6P4ZKM1_BRABE|nr:PREDICTED: tetratricopeptide repeat protein 39B-like [Branchiostoma belcheri]
MAEGVTTTQAGLGEDLTANDSSSEEEQDCEFEDAVDRVNNLTEMDLPTAIAEAIEGLDLFLNCRFAQAKSLMQPWKDHSPYHALGYGTILFMQAMMTFEKEDIKQAVVNLKSALSVCNRYRRRESWLESLSRSQRKAQVNQLTEVEIHSELCYAECLLQRACLTFVEDESLINFVKGAFKIKSCHSCYKQCLYILENRTWEDPTLKVHFESGVRLGVGAFNVMISLLPGKILKLLEFVGFSGNKLYGLSQLQLGADLDSLRAPLCSLYLIGYHTVVLYILGLGDGDLELADRILQPCLRKYPQGALFLFFAGRMAEVRGDVPAAIMKFEESIVAQSEWRQFHHLCYWELMWCHAFLADWLMAASYAERLFNDSKWSKACYMYQRAAFLVMCEDQTEDSRQKLLTLFRQVPVLKQRIAGKSLPIEKFAVDKSARYEEHKSLVLPGYELIYVWNGFTILGRRRELVEPVLTRVEATLQHLHREKDSTPLYHDGWCLATVLKGVCLKYLDQPTEAEGCFQEVVKCAPQIQSDQYLPPYACAELGFLYLQQSRLQEAKHHLEKVLTQYRGYRLESRLHFRVQAALSAVTVAMARADTPAAAPREADVRRT